MAYRIPADLDADACLRAVNDAEKAIQRIAADLEQTLRGAENEDYDDLDRLEKSARSQFKALREAREWLMYLIRDGEQ